MPGQYSDAIVYICKACKIESLEYDIKEVIRQIKEVPIHLMEKHERLQIELEEIKNEPN